MTIATNQQTNEVLIAEPPHIALRILYWLMDRFRPYLGWLVLAVCMALAALPARGLSENRVAELARIQAGVDWVGPLAVLVTWLLLGWRRPRPLTHRRFFQRLLAGVLLLVAGLVILSQTLIHWLPSIDQLWATLITRSWGALSWQILSDWTGLGTRFSLWWQGVRAGGAAQDNLIFADRKSVV